MANSASSNPQPTLTSSRFNYLLIAFASLILGISYFYMVTRFCLQADLECVAATVQHSALAPYRYRILPQLLHKLMIANTSPLTSVFLDVLVHGAMVSILLPALYTWLKRWGSELKALVGVLIFSLSLLLMFNYYGAFSTSIFEVALLTYALLLIDRSLVGYGVLLVLASLTRETAVILVPIYIAWHGRAGLKAGAGLLMIWAVITAGVHIYMGAAPHIFGLGGTLEVNLTKLASALMMNLPLIPLWVMAARNYRRSPAVLKRFAWIALIYVGTAIVGALWEEIRVLLPIFPLLLPIMLRD